MACCSIALQIEMQNQKHFNFILCENCFATAAHSYLYIAPCVFRRIGIESQRSGLRRWPKHWNWTVAWWASELALRSSKGCWHPSWHESSTLSSNERLLSQTWKMRDGTPETGLYLTIFSFTSMKTSGIYLGLLYLFQIFVPIRCCKHKPKTITQLKTKCSHFEHGTAEGSFVNFSSPWILWSAWPPWNPRSDPQELFF